MKNEFRFREAVSAYFSDPKLSNAVDELTPPTMLKGFDTAFQWHEFPEFVDAWVAAQKVVGEWAKDLFDLWDQVWGAALEVEVPYASPVQAIKNLSNGGMYEAWQKGWYQRAVNTPSFGAVGLAVFCEERGGEAGFHLQIEFSQEQRRFSLPEWTTDDYIEWDSNFFELDYRQNVALLDVKSLRTAAVDALRELQLRPAD